MKFKLNLFCALSLSLFLLCYSGTLRAQVINTVAGNGTGGWAGDGGPATSASCEIYGPATMIMDGAGNKYFADANNNRIRKISAAGVISTIAGTGLAGDSGDGGPASAAAVDNPIGIAMDAAGNIYFTSSNYVVRKISVAGTISLFAGTYAHYGYTGDSGPATTAELWNPESIAVDASGNVLIADTWNNVIRKVDASGTITTVYGNVSLGGYSGDGGPAYGARLLGPTGLFFDASWNLYFCDRSNNVIREINTSGIISTVAGHTGGGGGTGTYSGDGGLAIAADLNYPTTVVLDAAENMYIADNLNNIIRGVNASGVISTVAGIPVVASYTGDGGSPTLATLNAPWGLVLDASGNNLYIGDAGNARIRAIDFSATVAPVTITGDTVFCYLSTTALTGTPAGGNWNSSAPFIASVDPSSGVVSGVSPGTATINYFEGGEMASVTVTVIDCTTPVTLSGDSSVCVHATSTLTASTAGGTWSSSNPAVATVGLSSGVVGGVSAGTATIHYITSTGLASTTVSVSVCHGAYTSNTTAADNGLKLYPNPNSGSFSMFITSATQEAATVTITNMVGEKVKEFKTTTNTGVDVTLSQPAGIYFISVATAEGRYITKMMVE